MAEDSGLPEAGPSAISLRTQENWNAYQAHVLPLVRASAEKWRNGVLGLITLVTTGLVVAGPDTANDMQVFWRWGVTGGLLLGLLAVLYGLLMALYAAAGRPKRTTFQAFKAVGGDLQHIAAAEALAATSELAASRRWTMAGILVLLVSLAAWMVSPPSPATQFLEVTTVGERLCGELASGDNGELSLSLEGESLNAVVPFAQVNNVRVVQACDAARLPR